MAECHDGDNVESLLDRAYDALHGAKAAGGNRTAKGSEVRPAAIA